MALSRRSFLKLVGGTSAGAAILSACRPQWQDFLIQSPVRLPEDMVTGVDNWYATKCAECGAGCGVVVRVVEGRAKKVEGNPDDPISAGKLCVRGHASTQSVYHPDRIRRPMRAEMRGSGKFREISWDEALDALGSQLQELRSAGPSKSVVLATEPLEGHLALIASRFAAGHGNATLAHYEPMDQTVLATAIKNVFGTEQYPHFDIEHAKSILCFDADFLMGWISQVQHSRGYGEFRQGEGRERGWFAFLGSRFSGTAANADEWVPLKPGAEGKLALAIAYSILKSGKGNAQAAAAVFGANPLGALEAYSPEKVAAETGVPAERINHIASEFASHQPGIAIGGGAAGAQTNGLFNLTAIYALNHVVGSVGQKGGVVLNPPSPLASELAFKGVATGRYAATSFAEWVKLLDKMRAGQVGALLVRNANIVHGMPAGANVKEALEKVPFIASFSSFLDDTTYWADLVLPAHLPLEDWGAATPNPGPGFLSIAYQQPVVRPFLETRGFGDILLALGQELGLQKELPWNTFRDVLRESAQKLYQSQQGPTPFLSFEAYWDQLLQKGSWSNPKATAPALAAAATPKITLTDPGAKFEGDAGQYPLVLVPFEPVGVADGRLAHSPWMQSVPDPITTVAWATWVELNSKDAAEQGLKEGDFLTVETTSGKVEARLYPNPALPHGVLAIPVGHGHVHNGRFANQVGVNIYHSLSLATESATGSLAWAANRARITRTGARNRFPKMEGTVLPVDPSGHVRVVKG